MFSFSAIPTVSKALVYCLIVGFSSATLMNAASTLMIDLVPGQSSSVTACVRELIHELERKPDECDH